MSESLDDDLEAPSVEDEFDLGELSDSEKKEVVLRKEDEGKVFVIESAEIAKPLLRDVDGNFIPPKPFNEDDPDKKGYKTKVKVTYKDSDYISLLPSIKFYVGVNRQTNKKVLNPWFRTNGLTEEHLSDNFTAVISKLYFKYCKFVNKKPGKVTQKEFIESLPGMKVKLSQYKTKWKGNDSYRIDIAEFVK